MAFCAHLSLRQVLVRFVGQKNSLPRLETLPSDGHGSIDADKEEEGSTK